MKLVILLLFLSLITIYNAEKCAPTLEDCENMTSEYEKYRECMERRTKRSADCYEEDSCDKCDCNSCSSNTCNTCSNNCCTKCCQQQKPCNTNHCCVQTCRAECRSNACRTSCKKRCQDQPDRREIVNGDRSVVTDSKNVNNHNITTVIHLNNVINNTNLINLPISVNNTVLNNITNEGSYSGGSYYGGYYSEQQQQQQEGRCCMTIGPRQCVPQSTFPFMRCYHIRRKACGSMCMAPVVHYQTHEVCDNELNVQQQQPCRQQIVYIPQPQPRCAYQNQWPYVTCGNQNYQSCEGCYSHYIKREDVTKCSNFCYDDGYGVGPYYRQGPFYRPGFAHSPSCYQTGLCDAFGGYGYAGGPSYDYPPLPESGFPGAYPPQTYPFVIEDCENCTFPQGLEETVPVPAQISQEQEPQQLAYKNLEPNVKWNNVSSRMINIDASVKPPKSERYAEIKIKPTRKRSVGGRSTARTTTRGSVEVPPATVTSETLKVTVV